MNQLVPKKSLGQHWLRDETVLKQIVALATVAKGDSILEIGPGLGTLTEYLTNTGANITAVEFDDKLASNLAAEAPDNLEIINQDVLRFDFNKMPAGYKVVANIPYYLTSNLIRVLSELEN